MRQDKKEEERKGKEEHILNTRVHTFLAMIMWFITAQHKSSYSGIGGTAFQYLHGQL